MTNNKFICEFCGKEFIPQYKVTKKHFLDFVANHAQRNSKEVQMA